MFCYIDVEYFEMKFMIFVIKAVLKHASGTKFFSSLEKPNLFGYFPTKDTN